MDESVKYYIQKGRRDGFKDSEIKSALLKAGWNVEYIDLALGQLPGGKAKKDDQRSEGLRKWLRKFYYQHAQQIAAITALSTVATIFTLLIPFPVKIIVDSVFSTEPAPLFLESASQTPRLLTYAGFLMLGIFALRQVAAYAVERLSHTYSYSVDARVKQKFFRHILRLPIHYKKKLQSGDYIYRQNAELSEVARLVIDVPVSVFSAVVTIILTFLVMLYLNAQLAIIIILVVPGTYGAMIMFESAIKRSDDKLEDLKKRIYRYSEESVDNIETVQSYGKEDFQAEGLIKMLSTRLHTQIQRLHYSRGFSFVRGVVAVVGMFCVLVIGGGKVNNGDMLVGEMLIFLAYIDGFYAPLKDLTRGIRDLRSSRKDISLFYDVLTDHPEVDSQDKQGIDLPTFTRGISLRGVNIDKDDAPLLKNVNFDIPYGAKIGLVGPTGSGKTELLRTLIHFERYSGGSITFDGVELQEMNYGSLRSHVTYIDHNPQLFSDTILNNILYGVDDASKVSSQQVMNSVTAANAVSFIEGLPANYETNLLDASEFMTPLQHHKLAVTRAFVRNSPILLVDEPSLGLSISEERELHEILYKLMAGKTVILVSNRLSMLTQMDEVYVVDGGVVLNVRDYGGLDRYQSYLSTHELI